MEKISVNIKEIVEIKNNLDKSADALNSLLTGVEPCLIEEDWPYVETLGKTLAKSVNKIERIIKSVKKWKWILMKDDIICTILLTTRSPTLAG